MRALLLLALVSLSHAACGHGDQADPAVDGAVLDAAAPADQLELPITVPTWTSSYSPGALDILNPERGWFQYRTLRAEGPAITAAQLASHRTSTDPAVPRSTVVVLKMLLGYNDEFAANQLPDLQTTLANARTAGVKIVLRPFYRRDDSVNADGTPVYADENDLADIKHHIDLLGPTLRDNADVLATVQLGFLGPWGEFHSNALTANGAWVDLLTKVLGYLPPSRMVQIRKPAFKDHYFATAPKVSIGPLKESQAYDESPQARVGHFNDGFLGDTENDQGTYQDEPGSPDRTTPEWRAYAAQDTRFTAVGGETSGKNARASCDAARIDLAMFHWSFLGSTWYQPTIGLTGVLAPCLGEIGAKLGYRFELKQATWSRAVKPGHTLELQVRVANEGYAAPFNFRPLIVVLKGAQATYRATLTGPDVDLRRWWPGATTFSRKLTVPANAPPGSYSLHLWAPDADPRLMADPRFAIQLANSGTWDAATGENQLTTGMTVEIDDQAPDNTSGPAVPFVPQP